MLTRNDFPNPDNQIRVLKRYLHVLALIQNDKDPVDWNSFSLAKLLVQDELGRDISEKMVRDYLRINLQKDLGIDIDTIKGGRRTRLKKSLDSKILQALVGIYSLFVVSDSAREKTISRYVKAHGDESLWMLARLYFASIEKKAVVFKYLSRSEKKIKEYTVLPYHIVFRGNNLYLACRNLDTGIDVLFILSKIEPCSLKVKDGEIEFPSVPAVEELFSKSLGAFIGKKQKVVIRYTKNVSFYISDIIDCVDPKIKPLTSGGYDFEASFEVADDLYLCKQLFTCGKEAEIVSPASLRVKMKEMLNESLGMYE